MEIDITKIVSAKELKLDLELIKSKLIEKEEIVVFENNQPQFIISSIDNFKNNKLQPPSNSAQTQSTKIGKYVQEMMRKLFFSNSLSDEKLTNLTSENYSKSMFNLSFPVLKEVNPSLPIDEQKRDSRGYNRYYDFTLQANGKQYLLCSQWVEHLHREKFENWVSNFK